MIDLEWTNGEYEIVGQWLAPRGARTRYRPFDLDRDERRPHEDFASLVDDDGYLLPDDALDFVTTWGPLGLLHRMEPAITFVETANGWMTDEPLPPVNSNVPVVTVRGDSRIRRPQWVFGRESPELPDGLPHPSDNQYRAWIESLPDPQAALPRTTRPAYVEARRTVSGLPREATKPMSWAIDTFFGHRYLTESPITAPSTDQPEFLEHYGEPLDLIQAEAIRFRDIFREASELSADRHTLLTGLLGGVRPAVLREGDRSQLVWRPISLIDGMYLALVQDITQSRTPKTCGYLHCGQPFMASRTSATYCSDTCKNRAKSWRRRQRDKDTQS